MFGLKQILIVGFGGAIGSILRYKLGGFALHHTQAWAFPVSTFSVNVIGCLVLGGLTGAALPALALSLLGTGFCGALTTYSTFGYETVRLIEQRSYFYATANVVVSVISGLGAALLGYTAASAVVG